MHIKTYLVALAATAADIATPAMASPATVTTNAIAHGVVLLPLTLTKSGDLDFGTIVASSTAGTVVISPDDGTRSVTGGVTGVPSLKGGRALFQGAGAAGQNVLLTLAAPTVLTSGSNNITINSMTFDTGAASAPDAVTGNLTTTRTIDSTGAFAIGVGGNFAIGVNQPNGAYTGAFSVTADYQ